MRRTLRTARRTPLAQRAKDRERRSVVDGLRHAESSTDQSAPNLLGSAERVHRRRKARGFGVGAIPEGEDETATVAQYPYAIGEMGAQACKAAAAGQKLPESVKAPVALVTKDNVGEALKTAPAPFSPYENPFKK